MDPTTIFATVFPLALWSSIVAIFTEYRVRKLHGTEKEMGWEIDVLFSIPSALFWAFLAALIVALANRGGMN